MTRRLVPSEESEQFALAAWLNLRRVLWCHVPNGGWRNITVARKLKAAGVKPGVPDVIIFEKCPGRPEIRGVAIELKRRGTKRVSPEQQQWLAALAANGWAVKVCSGANDAIAWLRSLGL